MVRLMATETQVITNRSFCYCFLYTHSGQNVLQILSYQILTLRALCTERVAITLWSTLGIP